MQTEKHYMLRSGWLRAAVLGANDGILSTASLAVGVAAASQTRDPIVVASVAGLAILPMQDILGLDSRHRMNTPGTTEGNWRWRFEWQQLHPDSTQAMQHTLRLYGRTI